MDTEALTRVSLFALVLAAMLLWERLAPRRRPAQPGRGRRLANLGLVAIDTLAVRLVFPLTAVSAAAAAQARGWGLLPLLPLPPWLDIVLAIILLDLVIYAQHVALHAVPVLWRLHMVHHSDRDFDTTTGVRFHPLEIALSLALKMAAIVLIGAPPLAVLLFEILLNATSLFNHGNVALPPRWDRWLRLAVVTPDMHRVHHSAVRDETDSNFGFNLPWWDHLFGTYRAQPRAGHARIRIGLRQFQTGRLGLWRLLTLPFIDRRPS